jgi:glycyl-tRNA synthetase
MDELVALCKRRGFIYPTSEIYGGLANSYDYGPLGVELLRNIKDLWWREFITKRRDMVGIDSQILLNPTTWVASGHVGAFSDPLVEDVVTKKRYRADHVIEAWLTKAKTKQSSVVVEDMTIVEMDKFIIENNIKSIDGNLFTSAREFNLLFETGIGTVSGEKSKVYLRGETAQGIFTNFRQVVDSTRVKLPFGIGNIGKSFRNEITTGQYIFRTLEFEQAEIEYFFNPEVTNWRHAMDEWKDAMWTFLVDVLQINKDKLRWRQHTETERSHYSLDTYDIEYEFSFGWKELWGLAYRTDYDLKQHMQYSGKSQEVLDIASGKKYVPHVIEPALGLNRALLMVLMDKLRSEQDRAVLQLPYVLAPKKAAIIPLLRNKSELVQKAEEVFAYCNKLHIPVDFDDRGNIGKAYLYQDEIGTPYCITIDFDTLLDNTVTIRERDTKVQTRVAIKDIEKYLLHSSSDIV